MIQDAEKMGYSVLERIKNHKNIPQKLGKQVDDFKLLIQQNYPDVYNQNII